MKRAWREVFGGSRALACNFAGSGNSAAVRDPSGNRIEIHALGREAGREIRNQRLQTLSQ